MKLLTTNFLFLLIICLYCFIFTKQITAQTCHLRVSVFQEKLKKISPAVSEFITDDSTLIYDSETILTDINTKTAYKGALVDGVVYFRNLASGEIMK